MVGAGCEGESQAFGIRGCRPHIGPVARIWLTEEADNQPPSNRSTWQPSPPSPPAPLPPHPPKSRYCICGGREKDIVKRRAARRDERRLGGECASPCEPTLAAKGLFPLCSASWGQNVALLHFKWLSPALVCERHRFQSSSGSPINKRVKDS